MSSLGLTLSTAESCTGGLVSGVLTEIPGASQWFMGGVTAYSNRVKEAILAVPEEILLEQGAVSEAAVASMAKGASKLLGSDIALAVSGVAGPDGGSATKPVGHVCLACRIGNVEAVETRRFDGGRGEVRRAAVGRVLDLLLEQLNGRA